jgi:hypothetical protein
LNKSGSTPKAPAITRVRSMAILASVKSRNIGGDEFTLACVKGDGPR